MDAAKKQSIAEDEAHQQNVARLFQNVRKSGLQMRDNIPNDGNCMFHAVADQLNRLGEFGHSHTTLRHLAVETLRKGSHGVSGSVCFPLRKKVPSEIEFATI